MRYVPTLSEAAHALLRNIEHASRSLPGTQETRRMMRFATQAYRIKYGTPIFVTFSPDESQSLLMVRMSRTRRNDPVFLSTLSSKAKHFAGANAPDLSPDPDDVLFEVSVKDWIDALPAYDLRRRILATDALASVEGFRVMVQLTLQHLFGMNFCQDCPNCSMSAQPCQDVFGSSAISEGGIFGRVDAVYMSIEAQKSTGSLHAHSHLFVQCLHQHTSLRDILRKLRADPGHIVKEYLDYKTHVSRQVYSTNEDEV